MKAATARREAQRGDGDRDGDHESGRRAEHEQSRSERLDRPEAGDHEAAVGLARGLHHEHANERRRGTRR